VPVTPPRRTEAIQTGLDTYARATAFGAHPDQAAAEAIAAAIRTHETAVLQRISRAAELVAVTLRAQRSGRYSVDAAALTTFASNHITPLPTAVDKTDYRPASGDLVEVTLTGPALASDTVAEWILADESRLQPAPLRTRRHRSRPRRHLPANGRSSRRHRQTRALQTKTGLLVSGRSAVRSCSPAPSVSRTLVGVSHSCLRKRRKQGNPHDTRPNRRPPDPHMPRRRRSA
jgi:hypothetical protein